MLAEGIEIAVTVLYVFSTKSRIKWILPCAWGINVLFSFDYTPGIQSIWGYIVFAFSVCLCVFV